MRKEQDSPALSWFAVLLYRNKCRANLRLFYLCQFLIVSFDITCYQCVYGSIRKTESQLRKGSYKIVLGNRGKSKGRRNVGHFTLRCGATLTVTLILYAFVGRVFLILPLRIDNTLYQRRLLETGKDKKGVNLLGICFYKAKPKIKRPLENLAPFAFGGCVVNSWFIQHFERAELIEFFKKTLL